MSAVVWELEDKNGCPDCHHQVSMYLGASGADNEGMKVAYRCPNCGAETEDYIVGADDVIPAKFAWVREPDGSVTWFREVLDASQAQMREDPREMVNKTMQETESLYTQLVDPDGFFPSEWYAHRILKRTKKFVFVQHTYIGTMKVRKLNRVELETKGEVYCSCGSSCVCFYTEAKKKRIEEYRKGIHPRIVRHGQFCASRGQGGGSCDCQPMTNESAGAYNFANENEAEEVKAA